MTAAQARSPGLGYESPTEHTVASALAANHLIHRLNELDRSNTRREEASRRRQPATVDELTSKAENGPHHVSIKDRICCFQWTWFTSTMATGGIANVIASSESPGPCLLTAEHWHLTPCLLFSTFSSPMAGHYRPHVFSLQYSPVHYERPPSRDKISSPTWMLQTFFHRSG